MSRLGKLIELVIVVLVALLAAFGLIFGYRLFCLQYGWCSVGTSEVSPTWTELSAELSSCESSGRSTSGLACACGSIGPDGEAHEYNVQFPQAGFPAAAGGDWRSTMAFAAVRVQRGFSIGLPRDASSSYSAPRADLEVVQYYSPYSNSSPYSYRCDLQSGTDGAYEELCTISGNTGNRSDFRILLTNYDAVELGPANYCIVHNGTPEH